MSLGIIFASLLLSLPGSDEANTMLSQISEKYESLASYQFDGVESAVLGSDCVMQFPFQVAEVAPPSGNPSVPYPLGILFTSPKGSKPCFDVAKNTGGIRSPAEWIAFKNIDMGVSSIRILRHQMVAVEDENIDCAVLEVQYDDYYQRIRQLSGPVRYWVDPITHLVWRVEFAESFQRKTRTWTVAIESFRSGGPPPTWLEKAALYPDSKWMGKHVPNFELHTADGQLVRLADLRGKIVVLDFWATWCLACQEEIPVLEKLAEMHRTKIIVLGASDEDKSVVAEWLDSNRRSFRSLVRAKSLFDTLGITSIPALIVINREGVIADFVNGFASERSLRTSVQKALSTSPDL